MQIAKEELMRLIADMTAIPNTGKKEETVESADVISIIDGMCKKQKKAQERHYWHLIPKTFPCYDGDNIIQVDAECPVCGAYYDEVYSAIFVGISDDEEKRKATKTVGERMRAKKRYCSACGTRLYIQEETES